MARVKHLFESENTMNNKSSKLWVLITIIAVLMIASQVNACGGGDPVPDPSGGGGGQEGDNPNPNPPATVTRSAYERSLYFFCNGFSGKRGDSATLSLNGIMSADISKIRMDASDFSSGPGFAITSVR